MLRKLLFSMAPLLAVYSPPDSSAQGLGDKAASIVLPNITFTRSLNSAAENTKVTEGKLTLTSAAKRDNFRDPNGKLSSNTAPVSRFWPAEGGSGTLG